MPAKTTTTKTTHKATAPKTTMTKKETPKVVARTENTATKTTTTTKAKTIDPDTRYRMICEKAYFLAEKRGFAPGHDQEDWIQAEAQVDLEIKKQTLQ